MTEVNPYVKIKAALSNFENNCNIYPNRIVMGYNLFDKLCNQFYYNTIPIKTLEKEVRKQKHKVQGKFEGIPVFIDYDNPNILEVGYMSRWKEPKVTFENVEVPKTCGECKHCGHYKTGVYARNPHCCCELIWELRKEDYRVDEDSIDKNCPLKIGHLEI